MSGRDLAIVGAIVVAGAVVGLGAYLGLSSRPAPNPEAGPVPTPSQSDPTSSARPSPRPRSTRPSAPAKKIDIIALRKQTEQAALAAIEAERATMVSECWEPFAAKTADGSKPDHAKVGFSLAFRKDGTVAGSGVIEDRQSHEGLFDCLAPFAHSLTIPPPDSNISVEVHFQLP